MTKFEQIQRARDLRLSKNQRGAWNVVKVNDDGRTIVVERNVTWLVAEKLAGSRRDSMKDSEVGDGWNYEPRRADVVQGTQSRPLPMKPRANEYA